MGQGRAVAVGLLSSAIAVGCSTKPAQQLTPLPPVVPAVKAEPRMQGSPAVQPFLRLRLIEEELARGNAQNAAAIASEIIALGDTSASSAVTIARLRLPAIYAQLGDAASTDAVAANGIDSDR